MEERLIEQGWQGYRAVVISKDAPEVQIRECRRAFFAGATELFCQIMNRFASEEEVTEGDMSVTEVIQLELQEFAIAVVRGQV